MEKEILNFKTVHFIGIGGVSMSALALYLHFCGYEVTGSDLVVSNRVVELRKAGIQVSVPHSAKNITSQEVVVYSDAIASDNVELKTALLRKKCVVDRGYLLGRMSSVFDNSIAISGTHGKTTTTAMISNVLIQAEQNPTVHVGGTVAGVADCLRIGGRKYFVCEACEYKRNFLKVSHNIGVVLNVECDHMDYYKDEKDIYNAYFNFLERTSENGVNVVNGDDAFVIDNLHKIHNPITYGFGEDCMYIAKNLESDKNGCYKFDVFQNNDSIASICLKVRGKHNIYNALAAFIVANEIGIDKKNIVKALSAFLGVDRRMQNVGTKTGVNYILDYAHHPTEIAVALESVKNISDGKVICVFEPHTYSRLKAFYKEYITVFNSVSKLILAPIYAAREKNIYNVSSKKLAKDISLNGVEVKAIPSYKKISKYVKKIAVSGDVVLILGAGTIDKIWTDFLSKN